MNTSAENFRKHLYIGMQSVLKEKAKAEPLRVRRGGFASVIFPDSYTKGADLRRATFGEALTNSITHPDGFEAKVKEAKHSAATRQALADDCRRLTDQLSADLRKAITSGTAFGGTGTLRRRLEQFSDDVFGLIGA